MTKEEIISNIKCRIKALKSLSPQEPDLPAGLDEAAYELAHKLYHEAEDSDDYEDGMIECFKAGAAWRDAQISKLPDNVDEAAEEYAEKHPSCDIYDCYGNPEDDAIGRRNAFKAGAEWISKQGITMAITDETEWADVDSFVHKNVSGNVILQIRKKR